jgi:outer membrane receptor for ferrienterochelin and colicin
LEPETSLANQEAQTRTTIVHVPVNNLVDNLSWTKNGHTIQAGANWRLIYNDQGSSNNSFDSATINPGDMAGNAPDPTTIGLPAVESGFTNSYLFAYTYMVGAITNQTNIYNYQINPGGQSANLLPDGTFITRRYKANEWEGYLQDSWRVRPNLTLTYGVRYSLLQAPYEVDGQQIAPTVDLHQWFLNRSDL